MIPELPEEFLNSLEATQGFNRETFVQAHTNTPRITSLRLNPFKPVEMDFPLGEKIPWTSAAYYLPQRPSFTYDPLFHAGCYYVQEPGSMFIEYAVRTAVDLSQPLNVLDACAAPGGKSTLLNGMLKETDLLVSNEFIKSRAGVLADNLGRWGTANSIVTNNETSKFSALESFFDLVVVDAPCSGSGLFRKQPEAISEWSPESVIACSVRQKKILADLVPAIKDQGCLVYCTCSYSEAENEDIVQWLIRDFGFVYQPVKPDKTWNITDTGLGYRFYPDRVKSEGFFCAVLVKTGGSNSAQRRVRCGTPPTASERPLLNEFIQQGGLQIIKKGDHFHLLNAAADQFLAGFDKHFYFKKAGISAGTIKGRDFIPAQELAWSIYLSNTIGKQNLDAADAVAYLKKENFGNYIQVKGFSLMCYKDQGLGWAKLLGNRNNNYLPPELRILK